MELCRLPLVEEALDRVTVDRARTYVKYWLSVAPITPDDYLRRWLFSFASIQATWEQNIDLYEAVKDLTWIHDKSELKKKVKEAKAGMHNTKAARIWKFTQDFLANPKDFDGGNESWREFRTRIMARVSGLGYAKVAFVFEMTWPTETQVVCLDRHMLRLFGFDGSAGVKPWEYLAAESYWNLACDRRKVPPAIARAIVWDDIQEKDSSEYWCQVFHNEQGVLTRSFAGV